MTEATSVSLKRIQKIVAKKFSLPEERITADATLESLGLDSLDAIEMLFEVEDEFNIRMPQEGSDDRAHMKLKTMQDVVDLVEGLIAKQRPEQAQ